MSSSNQQNQDHGHQVILKFEVNSLLIVIYDFVYINNSVDL